MAEVILIVIIINFSENTSSAMCLTTLRIYLFHPLALFNHIWLTFSFYSIAEDSNLVYA